MTDSSRGLLCFSQFAQRTQKPFLILACREQTALLQSPHIWLQARPQEAQVSFFASKNETINRSSAGEKISIGVRLKNAAKIKITGGDA